MKKLVIMAGLPGSGKSYVRKNRYGDFAFVDCDEIKKGIEGYGPKNPGAVHEESKVLEAQAIYKMFAEGKSFVYDTTATNWAKVVKMTQNAQAIGYEVELCYVKVSLRTALQRNAQRERQVPEMLIKEKASLLGTAMDVIQNYVDEFVIVKND